MPDIVDLIRANVKHAQRRAKQILADPHTVVLDTETTGLVDGSYICDLAIIARGRSLVNTLVNPQVHIPPDASRIHGIYDEDVKYAPTFAELWPELERIFRESTVVIYNAGYDVRIIGNEFVRLFGAGPTFRIKTVDALALYQTWYFGGVGRSGRNQTKLVNPHCDAPACKAAVAKHQQAGAHRAYADCLATVERLKMIANSCWLHEHYRKAS
ncbi:MAG TPA: 3'-5' exonuclease [Nitrospira sp.]|nr:3'-5' exonuclease [Nitrospira sp.]